MLVFAEVSRKTLGEWTTGRLLDDPSAVPPPIASGLPFFVSMPNETNSMEGKQLT